MPEKKTAMLSVIVPTYNRATLLPFCLAALEDQTLDKDLYEVIVVNNKSTDNTEDVIRSFEGKIKNFRNIFETKQGLSYARNRGYQEAIGEYIVYIDDDAKADRFMCEKILRAFSELSPKPISVGAQVKPWYECDPPYWFKEHFELRTWGDDPCFLNSKMAQFGFCGACFAVQKTILQKYNGFSVKLGMNGKIIGGGEETDLFGRIFKGEGTGTQTLWYDPSIQVRHWCSKEQMTISYRLRRSYGFGLSSGLFRGKKRNIIMYLLRWVIPARELVFGLPSIVFAKKGEHTTNAVMLMQKTVWEIGYQIKR